MKPSLDVSKIRYPHINALIIDDSPQDIALLTEYLRRTQMRILVAFDGYEGYQKALVTLPDIILMDVSMPRTDGFAACRLLQTDAKTKHIPILFLSGCDDVDERVRGLSLGAVDYISKPFSAEEVLLRMNVHLSKNKTLNETEEEPSWVQQGDNSVQHITVKAAMEILLHDIANPPSLPDLARLVGTNERNLTRLFREYTQLSVFAWLREQRIKLACQYLQESSLDIQQIAEYVGYGNAGNFTTMFKERQGVTPREYRQTLCNVKEA